MTNSTSSFSNNQKDFQNLDKNKEKEKNILVIFEDLRMICSFSLPKMEIFVFFIFSNIQSPNPYHKPNISNPDKLKVAEGLICQKFPLFKSSLFHSFHSKLQKNSFFSKKKKKKQVIERENFLLNFSDNESRLNEHFCSAFQIFLTQSLENSFSCNPLKEKPKKNRKPFLLNLENCFFFPQNAQIFSNSSRNSAILQENCENSTLSQRKSGNSNQLIGFHIKCEMVNSKLQAFCVFFKREIPNSIISKIEKNDDLEDFFADYHTNNGIFEREGKILFFDKPITNFLLFEKNNLKFQ